MNDKRPANGDAFSFLAMFPEGSYRYERKFAADRPREVVEDVLRQNTAHFSEIYSRRWVNNLYLDTPDLASYQQNLDGSSGNRMKIRLRWYGDFSGCIERPLLEFKIKHGQVNRKASFALAPMDTGRNFNRCDLHALVCQSDLPDALGAELLRLEVVLANRYFRSYYLSADRDYRATVDTHMSYCRLRGYHGRLRMLPRELNESILELKYTTGQDKRVDRLTQQFPFRLTRSSKYATGIESG